MTFLIPFRRVALATLLLCLTAALALAQSDPKKKSIADLKESASAGDATAQVQLGVIYLTGDGVPKDDVEAVKWLRKAAEQDSPLAERYLGEMYYKGRGVAADNEEAAKWLRLAAEQDDARSQYNLAVLYTQGLGVPHNVNEALKWMSRAAEQHLAAGQMGMGAAYENGDGVPLNAAEAAKWYQLAVDQNYIPALNRMASLLATTTNPDVRDPKRAIALASKSVAAGLNPDYLDTLAAAYFAYGQTDKAIETEEKALARNPDSDEYKKAMEKYQAAAHSGR
jgi:TPR repeat protein